MAHACSGKGVTMSEFVREIESKLAEMWTEHPADIDRMLERKGAHGSNFTIVMFVKTDTQSAANLLYQLYSLSKKEQGDLFTIQKFAADFLSFMGMRFKNYYLMEDTHTLSMKAAVLIRQTKDFQETAELLRAVQRYFNQMAYWVDFSIPWKELSDEHAALMAAGKAAYGI